MGDKELSDVFIMEAKEIIRNLESDILKLEENPNDEEIINRIFRYFHTLKGSSGFAGFTAIYDFTHGLENLLDIVRSGKIEVSDNIIDLILSSIDWIKDEILNEGGSPENSSKKNDELVSRINNFLGSENLKPKDFDDKDLGEKASLKSDNTLTGFRYFRVKAVFMENIFEFGIDPLMLIEDLLTVGTIVTKKVDRNKLPEFEDFNPEKCYLAWDLVIKTRESIEKVQDVFVFVKDDNQIIIDDVTAEFKEKLEHEDDKSELMEKKIGEIMVEKGLLGEDELEDVISIQDSKNTKLGDIVVKKGYASPEDVKEALQEQERIKRNIEINTVRVNTSKLDNLLNLLGEIVIGQSSLVRLADDMEDESSLQLKNALYGLDRTTREFQEQIMSIRMIPIGPSFEQFRRFVRDSAHGNNKMIRLNIEGGETELDKTVIEKIGDPLKHMIRNSIDHGIETPKEREAAGKERTGMVTLKAYHQEGNVYIEISDDGRGIDFKIVKEKAVKLGLIKNSDEVSKERLSSFLFMPGFSTSEKVGDLSGRGVGMDVVKTNIEELRGTVEIKSQKGKGSTVRIKLPLTLAIIDAMLVSVGDYIYILPIISVVETLRPNKEDVKTVEGKGEVIYIRGKYLSLVRMYELFGVKPVYENPWEALVVIVESGESRIALLIDDLLGQQQIVIKSLDNFITNSRAISGATVMGDGKVALIIDIFGLVEDLESKESR